MPIKPKPIVPGLEMTDLEHHIIKSLASGRVRKQIAAELNQSEITLRRNLLRIRQRLGARTVYEACAKYAVLMSKETTTDEPPV